MIARDVKNGVYWDLGPYVKGYDNFDTINADVWNNSSFNGKIYGIPRLRSKGMNGMMIRGDWLKNLGLSKPKTLDDLYNICKAFTLNDPDKNGKNDTFGLVEDNNYFYHSLKNMVVWFGGPNGWKDEDGKLVPDFETEEFLEAMKFYRRLYQDNLISPGFNDYSSVNRVGAFNAFVAGKGGVYIGPIDEYRLEGVKDLDVEMLGGVEGPKGLKVAASPGYDGLYMIVKPMVHTEEKVKLILTFFNKLMDDEMRKLFQWGIEGESYEVNDGQVVLKDRDAYIKDVLPINQLSIGFSQDNGNGPYPPLIAKARQMYSDNVAAFVMNPAWGIVPDMYFQMSADGQLSFLTNTIERAVNDFIMGKIDENQWYEAVRVWEDGGGRDLMKQYNEEYAVMRKK